MSVKAKANNVIIYQEYMINIINCTKIDNCKVKQQNAKTKKKWFIKLHMIKL